MGHELRFVTWQPGSQVCSSGFWANTSYTQYLHSHLHFQFHSHLLVALASKYKRLFIAFELICHVAQQFQFVCQFNFLSVSHPLWVSFN